MRNLCLLLIFSGASLFAADPNLSPDLNGDTAIPSVTPRRQPGRALWHASLVTLAVANAADVHSSWGKPETNVNLSNTAGKFGIEGALLKLGLYSALFGVEYLIARGHPTRDVYRALSVINFGAATATGAIAAHNYSIQRQ